MRRHLFPSVHAVTSTLAAIAAAAALTACGTSTSGSSSTGAAASSHTASGASSTAAGAFPLSIHDHFGTTTISTQPKRVVAFGSSDPDDLLALGVVPVGIPRLDYGANAHGTTPWFDARLRELGAGRPTEFADTDAIPYADIAALRPDLILATNSGLTRSQYDELSKIAPVVAYPGKPWTTTWQKALLMDGAAVGRLPRARQLVRRTRARLAAARRQNPVLEGTTFIFGALETSDLSSVAYYTPIDNRPEFLTSLGMRNAPIITRISPSGQFYGEISAERSSELRSQVFITYAEKASDAATFEHDSLIGRIPAIASGHLLALDNATIGEAASVPTPLSIPYAIRHFVPLLARAAKGAAGGVVG
jgi:iron complex transport system substrate-binding protein